MGGASTNFGVAQMQKIAQRPTKVVEFISFWGGRSSILGSTALVRASPVTQREVNNNHVRLRYRVPT